jgi:hypothetical protein
MDDQKASAAYHPGSGPTPAVVEQAAAAGLERGDSFSYTDETFAAEQAEAEAGETRHDAAAAAANQSILDQLRELYDIESFKEDLRVTMRAALADQEATMEKRSAARVVRTRELLGIKQPTLEELRVHSISVAYEIDPELARILEQDKP